MHNIEIKSYTGEYAVNFTEDIFPILETYKSNTHLVIDSNIVKLYSDQLQSILNTIPHIIIEASETNKNLTKIPTYINSLVENNIKRDHTLIAVGGGIIQDITCFIATTMFRGMEWHFFPTTLLAQSDSCIGSKSSINVDSIKNLVGAFYPPKKIYISTNILQTLEQKDLKSGIGEMLKVHMIDSNSKFTSIAESYEQLLSSKEALAKFIYDSLLIKKGFIEADEFDKHVRNVMNYGHGFGHAIESATNFGIPHGIAVTIGMHMANSYSFHTGMIDEEIYKVSSSVFKKNYSDFKDYKVPFDSFLEAFSKDKKNVGKKLALILTSKEKQMDKYFIDADQDFKVFCQDFFENMSL